MCSLKNIWLEDGHLYYHDEKSVFKDDSNKTIVEKMDALFSELTKVRDFNVGDILIDKEMIKVFQKFEQHLFRRYHHGQVTIMQNCTFTGTKDDFVDFVNLFQEVQLWNFDMDNSIICDEDLLPTCVADSLRKDRPTPIKISLGTIEVDFAEAETMINGLKDEFDLKLRTNNLEKYRFAVRGNEMTIEFFTKEHLTNK